MNYLFARRSRRRPRTWRGLAWGVALTMAVGISRGAEMPDLEIADFEGAAYGDWTVTGEAFGPGPTHGTLPGQVNGDGGGGVGELVAATVGVGYMRSLAGATFPTDKVCVGIILLAGSGYVLVELLKRAEARFESWRPQ